MARITVLIRYFFFLPLTVGICSAATTASAIPLSFHDFFADPSVVVSADGLSAELREDPLQASVILSNDPFLGDPDIIIPGPDIFLSFDYDFTIGAGDSDEFRAFVFDADSGAILSGLEFFADASGVGIVSFELSPHVGKTLGLQFELNNLTTSLFDSAVSITNLSLATTTLAVAEPPILGLFFWACMCMAVVYRSARLGKVLSG